MCIAIVPFGSGGADHWVGRAGRNRVYERLYKPSDIGLCHNSKVISATVFYTFTELDGSFEMTLRYL